MMNVSMDTNLSIDMFRLGQAPFDTKAHPSRTESRQPWLIIHTKMCDFGLRNQPCMTEPGHGEMIMLTEALGLST